MYPGEDRLFVAAFTLWTHCIIVIVTGWQTLLHRTWPSPQLGRHLEPSCARCHAELTAKLCCRRSNLMVQCRVHLERLQQVCRETVDGRLGAGNVMDWMDWVNVTDEIVAAGSSLWEKWRKWRHVLLISDMDCVYGWRSIWRRMTVPLPSGRQHSSYGDCLEVKREYYQNSSVLDCDTVFTVRSMSSSYRSNKLGLSHWDPYFLRCA